MIRIIPITDSKARQTISRAILEQLRDWFEVDESREQYIEESAEQVFFAAFDGAKPVGFITMKETGRDTAELAVMGVLKDYHRQGVGRQLFKELKNAAQEHGYSFMQVKTVKMGVYEDYDITNRFYLSLGFKELEVLPLWDEANPCQIYVMYIGA